MILPELSLVLDVVIAVLLVAVIVYAVRLNRSLSVLQKSKDELEQMLSGFADSTDKAERAIQNVKDASNQNKEALGKLLGEAEHLRDDLSFMIERGNSLADRLDGGIAQQRRGGVADGDTASDIEDAMRAARMAADAPEKRPTAGQTLTTNPADRTTLPASRASTQLSTSDSGDGAAEDDDAKSKKKSALLRALQGMR